MDKMQSINKNLEELKNKHTKTNNTITEIKNTLEGINNRISEAEEWISELEDKMAELTSKEQNKVKRMKRSEGSLRDLWDNIKHTNILIIGVPGFPGGSEVKASATMRETWVWSLGQEESPGEENGNSLQYSCLENPMDRDTWWATVHGIAKSRHNWATSLSLSEEEEKKKGYEKIFEKDIVEKFSNMKKEIIKSKMHKESI